MSLAEAQDLYGLTGQSTEVIVTLERIDQESAAARLCRRSLLAMMLARGRTITRKWPAR